MDIICIFSNYLSVICEKCECMSFLKCLFWKNGILFNERYFIFLSMKIRTIYYYTLPNEIYSRGKIYMKRKKKQHPFEKKTHTHTKTWKIKAINGAGS